MKKKGLVLLLAGACLLTVGCGKDSEKDNSDKKSKDVKTLTCNMEEDGEKISVVMEQDKKTYKFTKATMEMSAPKAAYEAFAKDEETLKKMFCNDEDESYKSCDVKFNGDKIVISVEYDAEKYGDSLIEQGEFDKLDENSFEKLKKSAEDDGGTCTIK